MIRKLLIVFVSGLVLAITLLASAWVIGGPDVLTRIEKRGGIDAIIADDKDDSERATRTLEFDPAKVLTVDAPVNLTFTRGPDAQMVVKGSQAMMDSLRWQDGRLSLDGKIHIGSKGLTIAITAPELAGLVVDGAGNVELAGLRQNSFTLELNGAGNVDAEGKVDSVTISSSGIGNVDFSQVRAKDATISISGMGNAEVDASDRVDATISGAGNITLHRKPDRLTSTISGVGSIDEEY